MGKVGDSRLVRVKYVVPARSLTTDAFDDHRAASPQNRYVPKVLSLGNDPQSHTPGGYDTIRRRSLASCSQTASAWRRGVEMASLAKDESVV